MTTFKKCEICGLGIVKHTLILKHYEIGESRKAKVKLCNNCFQHMKGGIEDNIDLDVPMKMKHNKLYIQFNKEDTELGDMIRK